MHTDYTPTDAKPADATSVIPSLTSQVQLVLYRHRARISAIFAAFAGLESVRGVASPNSPKGGGKVSACYGS